MAVPTLDLHADITSLTAALCDIESVSRDEAAICDAIEAALAPLGHLTVTRIGNTLVARTELGRSQRVVLAGHIDTVPLTTTPPNLPTRREGDDLVGRGTVDMKGGVAVQLKAALVAEPSRDLTFVFYEGEEIDSAFNGLLHVQQQRPDLIDDADFAVLLEPTTAQVEGGCKGTLRVDVTTRGVAAHSARPWKGHNAIHDAAAVLSRLTAYEAATVTVDGLSITRGQPRQHLMTFAVGIEDHRAAPIIFQCPCTGVGTPPPQFVGDAYRCESGDPLNGEWSLDLAFDGFDAATDDACDDEAAGGPLIVAVGDTADAIEVRAMRNEPEPGGEELAIVRLELYIR